MSRCSRWNAPGHIQFFFYLLYHLFSLYSALSPDDNSFLVDLTINTPINPSCSVALKGFLDCGATGEFMHQNTAKLYSIPLIKLDHPVPLEVFDGRPISSGPVTHRTIPVLTHINNHEESISYYIVSSISPWGHPWTSLVTFT